MPRLLVFADIHGSLSSWLTVKALLSRGDCLAVAGDLFDTRYGNYGNPDFHPDEIRSDLKTLPHHLHYVYGNCDVERFYPGHAHEKIFQAFGKAVQMHHGHKPFSAPGHGEIIIQGHTHLCNLEKKNGTIYMNPGSITSPRNRLSTYGIIDSSGICLVELKTGTPLAAVPFD